MGDCPTFGKDSVTLPLTHLLLAGANPTMRLSTTHVGWCPHQQLWICLAHGFLDPTEAQQAMQFLVQHIPDQPDSAMLLELSDLLYMPESTTYYAHTACIPHIVANLRAVAYVLPAAPTLHNAVYRFRHHVSQHVPAQLFTARADALEWLAGHASASGAIG